MHNFPNHSGHVKEKSRLSAASRHLVEYARDWRCPPAVRPQSALGCLGEFVRRAAAEGLLSQDAVHVAGEKQWKMTDFDHMPLYHSVTMILTSSAEYRVTQVE